VTCHNYISLLEGEYQIVVNICSRDHRKHWHS